MSEPGWIDSHSVNCACCGQLVDERETIRNLFGGDIEFAAGELCQSCAKLMEETQTTTRLFPWGGQHE